MPTPPWTAHAAGTVWSVPPPRAFLWARALGGQSPQEHFQLPLSGEAAAVRRTSTCCAECRVSCSASTVVEWTCARCWRTGMLASRLVQFRLAILIGRGPSPSVELGSPRAPCFRRRRWPAVPFAVVPPWGSVWQCAPEHSPVRVHRSGRRGCGAAPEGRHPRAWYAAGASTAGSPGSVEASLEAPTGATVPVRLSPIQVARARGGTGRSKNSSQNGDRASSRRPSNPRPKNAASSTPRKRGAEEVGAAAPLA